MRRLLDTPDRRAAALAAEQGGAVSFKQLRGCGRSSSGIDRRVRRGWLHRLSRGVFAVGHPRLGVLGRRMAVVLALGEDAVICHRTAADAWELRGTTSGSIHVAVPTAGGRADRPGIRPHRFTSLRPSDVTMLGPLPITTPERTLLDVASALRLPDLVRAVEQGEKLRIVDFAVLEKIALRPVPGARRLRAAIGTAPDKTWSNLERRFLEICSTAGLPAPQVNREVGPYIVDALWPEPRVIVEVDSRLHHHTRVAFEADRRRDADLTAHGFRVVRITDERLEREPDAVAATVAAVLAQPRPAAMPWR